MEKTCGNCGHAKVCAVFINSETGCCQWSPCADTLEQRYQQLAEVARSLYKAIEPMHEACNEDTCLNLIDEGWPSDACLYDFRKQLEELGVSVDGKRQAEHK